MTVERSTSKCGAKTRGGTACQQVAGWGTDHTGYGRCKLHGGATPARVGTTPLARYRVGQRLGDLMDQFRGDPDPLNVLEELALLRALTHDTLERVSDDAGRLQTCEECGSPGGVEALSRLVDRISKVVSRVERARAQDAISRPELRDLLATIGTIVRHHVTDKTTLEAIVADWYDLTVRGGRP